MVTFKPRASKIAARDAEAMPLPKEDTTPPVTKIKRVMSCLLTVVLPKAKNRMSK